MHCARCHQTVPDGAIVCPFCTHAVADAPTSLEPPSDRRDLSGDDAPTSLQVPSPAGSAAPTSGATGSEAPLSAEDAQQYGRFLPGSMVAGRYRIVGLLGRGGMGEVYRADDLKLGQPVALKFLPDHMVASADDVRRLFDEVRMARKVSHPNVCRVFDVGETGSQHYVSMEYVDGEDLSSLLRRIGRLPEDKAVEIARQLCAALAAAHEEGVLHRDLKPANIMLDGRGRVKLTDFGLAAVAEVRAGTPVYMAPEQLAGTEVSVRSDIYSLGLVLHELLTGKKVFQADDFDALSNLHASGVPASLGSDSRIDPTLDRLLQRCLDKDPDRRPQSALAVAAGLPGADPLAAALAAGETPSPEMVAEAGGEGSLSLAVAAPLLAVSLILPLLGGWLQSRSSLVSWVPYDRSPVLLEARALEVLETLGYPTEHADTAAGFAVDLTYVRWLRGVEATPARLEVVSSGRAASIHYWWRGSPTVLVPGGSTGGALVSGVSAIDPPMTTPGMVALRLDTTGRLVWLEVVPERLPDDANAAGTGEADWEQVFALMELPYETFKPVVPRLIPSRYADERRAWEGPLPEDPAQSIRLEVASLGGRPTSLRVFSAANPLEESADADEEAMSGGVMLVVVAFLLAAVSLILTVIFGGLYVARRNLRSGRGDPRGARRLGFAMAAAIGVAWLFAEHTYTPNDINAFIEMLIFVSAAGGLTWALYLAVEPFMRRHAPATLIGWTRILDGQWTDPLVARDVLFGCAAGAAGFLLWSAPMALTSRGESIENSLALPPGSFNEVLTMTLAGISASVLLGLGTSFLYSLTFLALKRRLWLTFGLWLAVVGGLGFVPGLTINGAHPSATLLTSVVWLVGWGVWLLVLFRLGLLAFVVMSLTATLLGTALPTLDLSSWWGPNSAAVLTLLAGLALFAFYRCVEWKGDVAEALGGD